MLSELLREHTLEFCYFRENFRKKILFKVVLLGIRALSVVLRVGRVGVAGVTGEGDRVAGEGDRARRAD